MDDAGERIVGQWEDRVRVVCHHQAFLPRVQAGAHELAERFREVSVGVRDETQAGARHVDALAVETPLKSHAGELGNRARVGP
jgi:hypothetical protein